MDFFQNSSIKNESEKSLITQNDQIQEMIKSIQEENHKKAYGSINPQKGLMEPDEKDFKWGLNARGVRERFYNISFQILREISQRVGIVASIHNLRSMQVRPFSMVSYNDDDVGFKIKLKNKYATPNSKQEKQMEEIEDFFLNCGLQDVPGSSHREGMQEVNEMLVREILSIDQVAISLRRNKKGQIIDFWLLDGATIKRTISDKGYEGNKNITFVQEIESKIIETFTDDDMLFYYANRRTDIRRRGYGYSYIEMSLDIITAWLFGMSYNKEFFNSSAQPKGILTFEGDKLEQKDIEELQRQWVSMFRGIKGLWKTPFLQYNAKWQSMSPSNRDMEFNQYIQMLGSLICSIHGVDSAELGLRLSQAQNVLNENVSDKIAYSHDRGLKNLLMSIETIYNKILNKIPEWKDYKFVFTGIDVKSQKEQIEIEEKQVSFYMTVNEKRKEKDLEPIKGGDIVLNPTFIQNLSQMNAMEQQGASQDNQIEDNQDQYEDDNERDDENDSPEFEVNEDDLDKSQKDDDYITFEF